MRILGIDPGLNITGYGVLETNAKSHPYVLEAGIIKTSPQCSLSQKISKIYKGIKKIIEEFQPEALILEELYAHYRYPRTAILMGHVRGVIALAAEEKNIPLIGYSATRVKKALLGRGNVTKEQLQKMIRYLLGLKKTFKSKDASDALALALAHMYIASKSYLRTKFQK